MTFQALGVIGATAITAVTSQNTLGVQRVDVLSLPAVAAQIRSVIDDMGVQAVKTGMLATAEIIDHVISLAAAGHLPNLVVDPVLAASDGSALTDHEAWAGYLDLFKHAAVVTPNAAEAALLVRAAGAYEQGIGEQGVGDTLERVAERLHELSCGATVVVTGGDATTADVCTDIVRDASGLLRLSAPRVHTRNTHGTGCAFSAAITAYLATGCDRLEAVRRAKSYVSQAIAGAACWSIGSREGHGPLDHLSFTALPAGSPLTAQTS